MAFEDYATDKVKREDQAAVNELRSFFSTPEEVEASPENIDQLVKNKQQLGDIEPPEAPAEPDPLTGMPNKDKLNPANFAKGLPVGVAEAAENTVNLALDASTAVYDMMNKTETKDFRIDVVDKLFGDPKTLEERAGRFVGQYLAPYAAVSKISKAAGVIGNLRNVGVSSMISAAITDPDEKRLTDMMQANPKLAPYAIDYLASDPDDTDAESRFKTGVEAALVDVATLGLAKVGSAVFSGIKSYKAARNAKVLSEVPTGEKIIIPEVTDTEKQMLSDVKPLTAPAPERIRDLAKKISGEGRPVTAQELFQTAKRGVVSDEKTMVLAEQIVQDREKVEALINRQFGETINDEQKAALVLEHQKSQLEMLSMIDESKPFNQMSEAQQTIFRERLAELEIVDASRRAAASESARALRGEQRSVLEGGAAQAKKLKKMREHIHLYGGQETIEETYKAMQKIKSGQMSLVDTMGFRAKAVMDNISDSTFAYWVNNILSGTSTILETNPISNLAMVGVNLAESGLKEATGRSVNYLGETLGMGIKSGAVDGESGALFMGMVDSFKEAAMKGKQVFEGGMPEASTKFTKINRPVVSAEQFGLDPDAFLGNFVDKLGFALSFPTRTLSAQDTFFKVILNRGKVNQLAHREAMNSGFEIGGPEYAKLVKQLKESPNQGMLKIAERFAEESTLTRELGTGQFLGTPMLNFQKLMESVPMGRYMAPFIRVGTNQVDVLIQRTPFAPFRAQTFNALVAGGTAREEALAKIVFGSGMVGLSGLAAYEGLLTGKGPTDPKMKKAMQDTGWQSYAVKVGDKYIPTKSLGPAGLILNMGADISDLVGRLDNEEAHKDDLLVMAAAQIVSHYFTPTFLQENIPAVLETVSAASAGKMSPEDAQNTLSKFSTGFIPFSGLVKDIGKKIDPERRDTRAEKDMGFIAELWEQTKNEWAESIGISVDDLAKSTNIFGQDIVAPKGFSSSMISGLLGVNVKKSPAAKEILRLQMADPFLDMPGPDSVDEHLRIGMPNRVVRKGIGSGLTVPYKYTPKEYEELVKLAAGLEVNGRKVQYPDTLEGALNKLVKSEEYGLMTDTQKKLEIKEQIGTYRKEAQMLMMLKDDVIENLEQKSQRKRNMLFNRSVGE